jgi:hypothetical protein
MIKPKCSICDIALKDNDGKDIDGKVVEEQIKYWIHDPNNLHVDVEVTAHKVCVDTVKKIVKFKDFDQPTQLDYAKPIRPKIKDRIVKE